jgi:hypothetical protein
MSGTRHHMHIQFSRTKTSIDWMVTRDLYRSTHWRTAYRLWACSVTSRHKTTGHVVVTMVNRACWMNVLRQSKRPCRTSGSAPDRSQAVAYDQRWVKYWKDQYLAPCADCRSSDVCLSSAIATRLNDRLQLVNLHESITRRPSINYYDITAILTTSAAAQLLSSISAVI